jgi:recombination protein RecT
MTKEVATQKTGIANISGFLNSEAIKKKFTEILGDSGVGFVSSVLSVISTNKALHDVDRNSVYTACLMAASLKLPINQNLGLAYLVPYNSKQPDGTWLKQAQFQLGYRGLVQLAQRTGQFLTMNDSDVREGEIIDHNRLSGEIKFNWIADPKKRLKTRVIGYVSYFKLLNGFENTFYMTVEEIDAHAKKYSQTYKKYGTGLWKDEFDGMARKTVTKLNLSKNAPLSVDLQKAVIADQAVIKSDSFIDSDTVDVDTEYVDNYPDEVDPEVISADKAYARIKDHILDSTSLEQLKQVEGELSDDYLQELYQTKLKELKAKK